MIFTRLGRAERLGIAMIEANALLRHPIDVRRLVLLTAVGAVALVADVVRHDQDDVGFGETEDGDEEEQNQKAHGESMPRIHRSATQKAGSQAELVIARMTRQSWAWFRLI